MKLAIVILLGVVAAANAKAQRPYLARLVPIQYQKLEAAPAFPERQQQVPQLYRPQQEYSPPEPVTITTSTEADPTTTEATTTEGNTTEQSEAQEHDKEELVDHLDEGVYYIYHPSGLLQRIVYATKNDFKNMAYSAQLKYQNVEPIRDPIYTYDPETYLFQQVA